MTGKRYAYAMTHLDRQGVLHPDAYMFVLEDFYQAETNVVIAIMTQLLPKAGLKEWGDKAHSEANSKMKQLHLRNTFIHMHSHDLTYKERQMVSCSSSRWDFHFHSYVLTIYVRLY